MLLFAAIMVLLLDAVLLAMFATIIWDMLRSGGAIVDILFQLLMFLLISFLLVPATYLAWIGVFNGSPQVHP